MFPASVPDNKEKIVPRSKTLKCFQGNLDGQREGLVIASSQQQAASIANTSIHELRTYWVTDGDWPDQEIKVNCLYTRPICSTAPWVEGVCKLRHE